MYLLFTPDMSPDTRRQILQDNADKIEETTYQKPLTEEEMEYRHKELAKKDIELDDIEDEKKDVTATFTSKIKTLKTEKNP